jgi:uncharacterized membrane protein
MRVFRIAAIAVLSVQLVGLLIYSTHLYLRFDVSVDFAHNVQAWYLIGKGNLNPTDTVRIAATPFWRDHFDLIIWPLGLLGRVWPQPVVLLWLQDLAIVAAEAITLLWAAGVISERLPRHRNAAGVLALIALVANPWWYEATSFDIHMPPLGLPFVVLAGYSFWKGRYRRACVAAAISLLFGAVVVELTIVVCIAAFCSRRVRQAGGARWAAGAAVIGLAWIGVVNLIGANEASNLASNYGYLANPSYISGSSQKISLFAVARGAATHPGRVVRVLHERWRALAFELVPTGVLGLLTPWGFFMLVGLLIPSVLTSSPAYSLSTAAAFQNLPAMPFIFIGSVMVLTRIATARSVVPRWSQWARERLGRIRAPIVALVLALAATGAVVVQGGLMISRVPSDWLLVTPAQATTLKQATNVIPEDAEVIASYGVIGRFAERPYILTLAAAPQPFEISARTVFFVITPRIGAEMLDPTDAAADVTFVQTHLDAQLLINTQGIAVLEWHPQAGVRSVVLPGVGHPHP